MWPKYRQRGETAARSVLLVHEQQLPLSAVYSNIYLLLPSFHVFAYR